MKKLIMCLVVLLTQAACAYHVIHDGGSRVYRYGSVYSAPARVYVAPGYRINDCDTYLYVPKAENIYDLGESSDIPIDKCTAPHRMPSNHYEYRHCTYGILVDEYGIAVGCR